MLSPGILLGAVALPPPPLNAWRRGDALAGEQARWQGRHRDLEQGAEEASRPSPARPCALERGIPAARGQLLDAAQKGPPPRSTGGGGGRLPDRAHRPRP